MDFLTLSLTGFSNEEDRLKFDRLSNWETNVIFIKMKQTKKYKGIIAIFNDLFQNCQVICTVWIWPLCVCGFFLNQRRGSFMFFVLNINVSIKEDMWINYLDISVAVSLFFIFFCGVHTCIANTLVNRSEN